MTSKLMRAGLAVAGLLAACVAAEAADMKVKALPYKQAPIIPVATWSGFYFGINGGFAWGDTKWQGPPGFGTRVSGPLIGLTYGYNMQSGSAVFGIEGDIDWADINGSSACGLATCGFRNNWLGTVRGRIGQSFNGFLPYLTGGLAYGGVRASNSLFGATRTTQIGWTVGAGFEMAFGSQWSAKLEYLYVDLGSFDCGLPCGLGVPQNVGMTANVVRAGLNYKFDLGGGLVVAKY